MKDEVCSLRFKSGMYYIELKALQFVALCVYTRQLKTIFSWKNKFCGLHVHVQLLYLLNTMKIIFVKIAWSITD